ncbi:uncharacterized protein LOC120695919 [Panicum virgatum]|nr:uncharacterized protein LOC120695919 [Panicum virgatum]
MEKEMRKLVEICATKKEEGICAAKEEGVVCATKEEEGIGAAKEDSVMCAVRRFCVAKGEDSWSRAGCKICVAKTAALNRIKAAGGDSIKAAEDSASRAVGDICVVKAVPLDRAVPACANMFKGKTRPVGVLKKTISVPEAYIKDLLTDPKHTPLLPLSEDFLKNNPHLRQPVLNAAVATLSSIEKTENILCQFFEKGCAAMEVEVDYDY